LVLKDWLPPVIYDNLFTVKKNGAGYFFLVSGNSGTFDRVDCLKSYQEIPEVNAIINMKARAFSNMRLREVDKDGKDRPTPKGQALIALLQNPNWFQQFKEFAIQSKVCREVFGNEYIFKTVPLGFNPDIERVKALYSIPDTIVNVKYDNSIPFYLHSKRPQVTYEVKQDGGKYLPYDSSVVIHFNDNRINIEHATDKNLLKGESKLTALSSVINNMRIAYESRGVILKYRGANGAWVNDGKDAVGSVVMDQKEKDRVQDEFKNYGTRKGQYQSIITDLSMRWEQAGVNNPKNLGLFEETQAGFDKLLDEFGVPAELFVRAQGSTYENQHQAEKGLYVRTVMPEANEWIGGISSEFLSDSKTSIIAEYLHLPIFQEDLKSKGDAITTMVNALSKMLQDKQLTSQEYREELSKIGIGDGSAIPTTQDANQQEVETLKAQATLRGSVGGVQGILAIQTAVSQGTATREAALATLTIIYGFTDEQAANILGSPQPQQGQTF
jgi:phage portal protein BeeE